MKAPSLETLLTHPAYFGLTTASPLQRAICRITDGLPLGDLACEPTVVSALGGRAAIAALPVGAPPTEIDIYSGIRTFKSLFAGVVAFARTQTVDISALRHGEIPRLTICSLDVDKAHVVFRDHLVGTIESKDALRSLLIGEPTKDSLLLRHPSGRAIEVKVVAGARAGGQMVARWSAGVVFDEKPRMLGSEDGAVVNFDDADAAVEGRLLPGAQKIGIGSPWAPWGPAFDDVQKDWGRPTRHKVVIKAPAPALNPSWWTPQRCADLLEKNPRAYKSDVLAEFGAEGASAIDPADAARMVRSLRARSEPLASGAMFIDSSSGRGDGWAFGCAQYVVEPSGETIYVEERVMRDGAYIMTHPIHGPDGQMVKNPKYATPVSRLYIDELGCFEGEFARTVSFADVVAHIATIAKRHGMRRVFSDQHLAYSLASEFARHQIEFVEMPWSAPTKVEAAATLRRLLREGTIVAEPGEEAEALKRDLSQLQERFTPTGTLTITARRTGFGHSDRAMLLMLVAAAESSGAIAGSPMARRTNVTAYDPYTETTDFNS